MTTVEGLLSWEPQKLESLIKESGDVAKLVNVFREFLLTIGDERQRFASERNVLSQQAKVADLNAEQRCSEMQHQIYELSNKLNQEADRSEELSKSGASATDELSSLKKKIDQLQFEKNEVASKLRAVEADSTDFKFKLEDALRRLHYKEEEMKRINCEWETITAKEGELSKLQAEARAKLSDVDSRTVSLKFREERLCQEKDIVTQQNTWLTDELTAKTNDLSKLRQSFTETSCKLKSELAEKTEEATFLNSSHGTLKNHSLKLEKRVGELVNKLQDKDTRHLAELENIRLQLNKQERLAELYSTNCDEYKSKIKDLTTAITEMQAMLKQAQEDHLALEHHCSDQLSKHLAVTKELESKIAGMQNELEHANDLILNTKKAGSASADNSFDISQLSSTAVAVGGMMKSGMTIVQMYSAYVEATEALALEKDKNRLQSQYLEQILKEIEEKAPLLQQQRADYENALLNQDNLSEKLEKSMSQVDHYRIACEESQNASRALKRENERFKTQLKDLSQQIQVLIKEVEDARAGRVSRPHSRSQSPAINSSRVSSSSQVISDQLVNFRSIAELQQQNSKLLCVVRELSEEQERRETEDEDPKIVELRARLESGDDQIKELKLAQQRQVEMVEAVARQRDMYRVLLAQAGHNMGPVEEKKEKSKENDISSKHELALSELQKEFMSYKTEKRDQIALVQEQLDGMRMEHSTMLAQKTRLASKLEFVDEKYKIMENSFNSLKTETKQYREKGTELSTNVMRLQLTNDRLQNENITSRDELSKMRHSLEGQRKTGELLRVNEIKQRTQNESLVRESRTQNMLLSNLQTIHNNLERQEFERKERTNKKIDLLESELSEARRKLQSTELRYKTAEAIQNTQHREIKTNLEKERKMLHERQEMLDTLQVQHNTLLSETAELKSQIETLQYNASLNQHGAAEGYDMPNNDKNVDETISAQAKRLKGQTMKITELQHKLIEMNAREESLKSQVGLAKQHAQQYKGISEAHELALKELSQSEQSVKTASEELISQNSEEICTLTEKLTKANDERQRLQAELEEYQTRGSNEIRELNGALTKTQHQLEECRQKEESAIALEQEIRVQFSKLDVLYEESQNSLSEQRERCVSLEDKVGDLTKQVTEFNQKLTAAVDSKANAERKLEEDTRLWASEKRSTEQERDTLKERAEDLDQQNVLLHSQLATLSKDVVDLQKAIATDQPISDSTDASADKSTEELWEIVRYVRREKDILATKIEVTDSEAVRYRNRCSFLEKQIEETRKCLDEERSKSDSSIMSLEQHQDMLKKVEEAQALAEKVKMMTEERSKLTTMTSLLKQQIAAYEKQLKPLKLKNRELSDKVSVLLTEKEGLKKDVSRWSNRTNELIEQCNKVDAKEFARLQAENNKLKIQLKKNRDDHNAEVTSLQEKQRSIEEEGGRVSEEKRQLLGTINSMKADGTKIRIELNTVSAELKTFSALAAQQKTELDKLRKDQQELVKETAEAKKLMEEQKATDQNIKDNKDSIIQKLRTLAKKYKAQVQSQSEAQDVDSNRKSEEEQDRIKKAMDGMRLAKQKIDALTLRNKELETAVSESNSSTELLRSALENEKDDAALKVEEMSAANAALQARIQQTEEEVQTVSAALESKRLEMEALSERMAERAADTVSTLDRETNTDILISRLDQQTNTEDTPTASVKPTTIIGLSTPTAAVRPTSMAPDIVPRMATVMPTNTVHTSSSSSHTSSSSSHLQPHASTSSSSSTTTQVSSSSVQGQGESSHEVTTNEVRAILRSSPRISSREASSAVVRSQRDEVSSAAGIKRSRADDDEEDQPGPSTKIAMVTSSAHVQHSTESATSEVSQSSVFGMISQSTSRVESSHSGKHKQPSSVVSSTEVVPSSSSSTHPDNRHHDNSASSTHPDNTCRHHDNSADVSSSEAGSAVERDLVPESNEATPAVRVAMETSRAEVSLEAEEEEEELMRDQNTESEPAVPPPVIEIASDSEGSSSGMSNEDDVYSGFEEVEEDSRQLQFSFVQSSGTDPVMDILSEPDEQSLDLLEEASNDGACPTTSSTDPAGPAASVRSLRSNDTPWAHLASSSPSDTTQAAPSSSSSNVRSIRRIKRQPPKKE